jgi:hypothetical protein
VKVVVSYVVNVEDVLVAKITMDEDFVKVKWVNTSGEEKEIILPRKKAEMIIGIIGECDPKIEEL